MTGFDLTATLLLFLIVGVPVLIFVGILVSIWMYHLRSIKKDQHLRWLLDRKFEVVENAILMGYKADEVDKVKKILDDELSSVLPSVDYSRLNRMPKSRVS